MRNLNRRLQSSTSTRQFLLSKIDAKPSDNKPVEKPISGTEILASAFPDLLSGKEFEDAAMERLATVYQFGVLIIKIDDLSGDTESDRESQAGIMMDIASCVQSYCEEEDGFWGRIEPHFFACFFPDKSTTTCRQIAENVQKKLSALRPETVSIGISAYPTINYQKDQVLENACKALDHASFFGPDSVVAFDAVSLNISGDNRYAAGDIHGAVGEFNKALMLDPTNVNVHNSLGVCYGVLGDLDKALESFEAAIWLETEEFMAIYNIGMVHLLKDDKDKALEFFLKADRREETVFEVRLQTGKVYVETGRAEDAKEYLESAVKLQPTSGSAFRYLGDCHDALGSMDEAISAYKTAVKLSPNDAASLSALGDLYDRQGENPEISTALCLQSVEISPDNGLYRHRLGSLYLKQNRFEEALKEFEAARELGHDSIEFIEQIQNRMAAGAS